MKNALLSKCSRAAKALGVSRARLGVACFVVLVASERAALAQDAGDSASRQRVVAKVGTRIITAGELQDRLDAVPRFQQMMFGTTKEEVRKRFFDEVILREALYAEAAKARGVEKRVPVAQALRKAEAQAMVRAVEKDLGSISPEEVATYYAAHRAEYDTKERVNLWRIVCKTKQEAEEVIAAAKIDPSEKKFVELAEAHSQDKSTHLRGGGLGFVALDGSSEPRVDPAILKAAAAAADGELVVKPIVEGEHFSVLWRRGHIEGQRRKFEDLEPQLRSLVTEQRRLRAVREHTDALRAKSVSDEHPEYLEWLELPIFDAGVAVRKVPLVAPKPSSSIK